MNATWQAISSEAGIAAEQMAIGVTALGKANYAQKAYYGQAFFALTIGFERAAKLALVVDHAIENSGVFPQYRDVRDYGHDLYTLLKKCDDIALRRNLTGQYRLPQTNIHQSIITVLSEFASNVTRYYNLDFITNSPRVASQNPLGAWHNLVVVPILDAHIKPQRKEHVESKARFISTFMEDATFVSYHSEQGEEINTFYDASVQTGMTKLATPYVRMYVMQIARFLALLLSELGYAGQYAGIDSVPHLSEFFAIFNNSDNYLRNRKSWSIYRL